MATLEIIGDEGFFSELPEQSDSNYSMISYNTMGEIALLGAEVPTGPYHKTKNDPPKPRPKNKTQKWKFVKSGA